MRPTTARTAPPVDRRAVRSADAAVAPPSQWDRLERQLEHVRKPAQYVGGEHNQVVTRWQDADVRWALCYPDAYEVGQPNQGIQILYEILNERSSTLAERAYAPWIDLEEVMRREGIEAFTLERHHPLWAFDVFAVTLPHELGHTNLLNLLDLGGIPLRSQDRTSDDPIVLVGGHAAFNPEPLAPFVDAAVAGDGEEVVLEIDDAVRAWKRSGDAERRTLLRTLAAIEGVYIPAFHEPRRTPDGRLKATVAVEPGVPSLVPKRTVQDLSQWPYPKRQIVPMTETVHERFSVEIFRGCTRGCRFCQAGMITRPVRERTPEDIRSIVREGLANTGFEEVGLLSLSSADHSGIGDIATSLADEYEGTSTSLSLPSTRVDAFNVTLSNELSRNGRRTGLTFAPEAGSERMRAVINKMVSEDDLLRTTEIAFANGWRHVKLYFMIGLPTETDDDVLAIADLGIKVLEAAQRHGRANKVTISVGGFVPKPHTPFQWAAQDSPEQIQRKLELIKSAIREHGNLRLRTNDPEEGVIEGLLARGGRELADVIETAWRNGARFDGWHEMDTLPVWLAALTEHGIDLADTMRERDRDEVFPWDHLDAGLDREWLWSDWQDAIAEKELDDCRWIPCYDCGVCPGLDLVHDTGWDGTNLPIAPSPSTELPTVAARLAS
ncbi:MAG: TIGR03960 family B12-binding radical SAM protein [Nitriliruptorales bacterium]|nr:TIGR03960 family B12-binding radical SAM protein [Nitriliruptorales bacterium]